MSIILKRYYFLFLACGAFFVSLFLYYSLPGANARVWALDIGQGDSFFIETPRHTQVIIDGGPSAKVLSELSSVMPFYDKTIDLMVLTHPQEDHIFGLVEVLKRYRVENVLMTGVGYTSATYDEFKRLLKEKNVHVFIAQAGERVYLDEGATIDALYPLENLSGREFSAQDVNDTSVATLFSFGAKKFLFLGDATMKEETDLINSGENIDIDVLKLSHHGSKTSTSQLFLDKTTPELAFASMGYKNRYGHPHKEVLDRLGAIPFYRTDTQGRIEIATDGNTVSVKTEK
ncbi:MBL fold metallo-hydrolase [Candidatus Azambacteria bacterium]|nr:MBL fold metallo-hydrolase [Candidatus Azambacteria bacterium]MBI3685286.1 MBL fold metallo-hydrolase [Candidatus Azambacteria bacterium]